MQLKTEAGLGKVVFPKEAKECKQSCWHKGRFARSEVRSQEVALQKKWKRNRAGRVDKKIKTNLQSGRLVRRKRG